MNDFSLIRLKPSFDEAKDTRPNKDATIGRFNQVILRSGVPYFQTTNLDIGISFGGNYQVLIVDCADREKANVTQSIEIRDFVDRNGVNQIHFEYIPNNDYYGEPVFLKFIHLVSGLTYWSNPILITDYNQYKTTRIDYKIKATDEFFKSIELNCRRERNSFSSTQKEQTTTTGVKRTTGLIETEFEIILFDDMDNLTYRSLNKEVFQSEVIYVDGYRMTDKFTFESKNIKGTTNVFETIELRLAINYDEYRKPIYQLFQPYDLIAKYPQRNYTLANLGSELKGTFTQNTILKTGFIKIYKDNVLFLTFTEANITLVDDLFTIDITGLFTQNGNYYVNISDGLFESVIGEVYEGISNSTDWAFRLKNNDYSSTDYTNDYLN